MAVHKQPDQFELWADLAEQNKHLRRNNWFHWGVHLLLVVAFALSSMRPMTAIRVDQLGKAELVSNVAQSNGPGPEEAEHVTRLTAHYLLDVTSGAVARDLSKAMALMTADFQRAYREKVKEDATLAALEKGNVRAETSFDPKFTQVKAEKDRDGRVQRYFVQLNGKLDVYRADVLTAPLLTREVTVRATLLVVPRTPATLNGLLVEFFEKDYLDAPKAAPTLNTSPLPVPQARGGTP